MSLLADSFCFFVCKGFHFNVDLNHVSVSVLVFFSKSRLDWRMYGLEHKFLQSLNVGFIFDCSSRGEFTGY